jgi:hypothetical protein
MKLLATAQNTESWGTQVALLIALQNAVPAAVVGVCYGGCADFDHPNTGTVPRIHLEAFISCVTYVSLAKGQRFRTGQGKYSVKEDEERKERSQVSGS